MMTDPIADMLNRLRNANSGGQKRVAMPASRLKVGIAEVLLKEGFIGSFEVLPGKPRSDAGGFDVKLASVVNTDKSVGLALNLDHPAKAAGTFVVAPGRTLLWHVGETREGRRLFVLATPRVVVVEEEERIFLGVEQPIPGR